MVMILGERRIYNSSRRIVNDAQALVISHYFKKINIISTHRLFSGHHNVKKLLVSKEYALKVLGLKTFSNEEIRKSFKELQRTPPIDYSSSPDYDEEEAIDAEKSIAAKLQSYYSKESTTISSDELTRAAVKITALLTDRKEPAQGRNDRILLTYDEYHEKVNALGRKLDPRTSNIALSFLLAGSSVGIIIPCMPILVTQLGNTSVHITFQQFIVRIILLFHNRCMKPSLRMSSGW